jgi:voltage-gated potassium channel Kch
MALSPLLGLVDAGIRKSRRRAIPDFDRIQGEAPQVIIAGFGRFGQIFARVLRTQGIEFVAIDHDPEQIELVRRFGNKVYYGDAARVDLLEAAGARQAKYLVLAVDDVEASMKAARMAKENFPNLKIFARARNRGHAFDLMGLGIAEIKRETFDSSVYFVGRLLVDMGMDARRVGTIIEKFKRHDEIMLVEQFKVRDDDASMLSLSRQGVIQLAEVLKEDETRSYVEPGRPQETP